MMRSLSHVVLAAAAAVNVAAHATFQQLWVDGVDYIRLNLPLETAKGSANLRSTDPNASAHPRATVPSPT